MTASLTTTESPGMAGGLRTRIGDALRVIEGLKAELADQAFAIARGDPEALRRAADLRSRIATARGEIEDLEGASTQLRKWSELEAASLEEDARKQRIRRAHAVAAAREKAAAVVDRLAVELAGSMRIYNSLASLAHETSARVVGAAAATLSTSPCGDAVLGLLVKHGGLPRDALPAIFVGEMGYILTVADAARRHAASLAARVPLDKLEAVA